MVTPPYSVGQKSGNDNAQTYPKLDARIADTYVANSETHMNSANYDSYIKAFRWASDRLTKDGGIIAFVSNGAWLDSVSGSGFRKCLDSEFSSIYVFNLRGNQRTSGELSRREGGKIFGSGSRTPISITILVKTPTSGKSGIFYSDIGDYLTREEKLNIISKSSDVISMQWSGIVPNLNGDWLNKRSNFFGGVYNARNKEKNTHNVFALYTSGVMTHRDSWAYNFSSKNLNRILLP